MGFLFTGFNLATITTFIGLVFVLLILNELTRRNIYAALFCYMILPIVIIILISLNLLNSPSSKTWFGVVKTFSALIGVLGFMAIRFTKLQNTKFTTFFPLGILVLNILEAITRDLEVFVTYKTLTIDEANVVLLGGSWNIMNAIAGILLILTLTGWMKIKISKTSSKDMIWADQLWFWILAYDMWNLAYCYNCISTRSMYAGFALIISCTLAEAFFKRGAWLQHRAQTLALFGMFSLVFDYQKSELFAIEASYEPKAWFVLSLLALMVNLGVFLYELYVIKKYHKNPLKEEVYTHLNSYKVNLEENNL